MQTGTLSVLNVTDAPAAAPERKRRGPKNGRRKRVPITSAHAVGVARSAGG